MGREFKPKFQATRQLRTVFWTSFRFLTKVAHLERNDICAECFDAIFEQQNSCARGFGQVLAVEQKWPISNKKTVAQIVLTPISSNRTNAQGCFGQVLAIGLKTLCANVVVLEIRDFC